MAVIARRGSGASFGRRRGYEDLTEAEDSYEITEWLARQPFSNGRIGVYGCSNTGEAAMHVLAMRPPHLQAVFAGCFSFNRFDGFARGGLIANWGAGPQRSLADDLRATPVDGADGHALLEAAARSHAGSAYLLDLMAGMPYRDSVSALTMSRFWYEASVSSYLDAMRASGAALYIQAGWRDDFRAQGLVAWANYLPGRRYIVVGDWQHCANTGFDLRAEQLRFYDAYLKDIDTGITRDAAVHYQVIDPGHGMLEWQAAASWPVRTVSVMWRVQPDGVLAYTSDGGHAQTPSGAPSDTPDSTPGHTSSGGTVAHTPGTTLVRTAASKPANQPPGAQASEARGTTDIAIDTNLSCPGGITDPRLVAFSQACDPSSGGAHWTGPALTASLTIVGHPLLHIRVGASTPQPRLFAYLEDVAPDGRAAVVTDARLALALRRTATPAWDTLGLPWHEAWEADLQPLKPGEMVDADIAFLPTAYVFAAGHRLRLAIAGADPRERLRPAVPAGASLTVATGQTTLTLPEIP